MYVRSPTYLFILGSLLLLPAAVRAEGDFSSQDLKVHLLTDAEISERCAASIAGRVDMQEAKDENGQARFAPRCVLAYETMRALAESYMGKETAAVEVIGSAIHSCEENNTQENCLNAGRTLTDTAADSHEELAGVASEAEKKLEAFVVVAKAGNQ